MKQNNMFKRNLLRAASWTLAHTSWISMTLSPVAMGKQAEKNSVEYFKQQVHEIGLDKKITAQEFWEKVKNDLPGYAYFEIEQAVKQNPNALMPKFEVSSSKTSDGQVIPVITFTENGKTSTIQLFGEKEKFMKYNNVVVSENDSQQPSVLFQKLIDNDAKLNQTYKDAIKKELRKSSSTSARKDKSISKFTEIDKNLWKKMTAEQRVSYIIYMRQLYLDAQNVLSEQSGKAPAGKKTSSVNVFELLFNGMVPAAEAQDAEIWAMVGGKKVKVTTNKNAKSCIVAGYVSQEAKTSDGKVVCSVEVALRKDRYQPKANSPLPFVSGANTTCQAKGPSFVACNPIVYSYDSNGAPHCIDRSAAAFQTATHWDQGTNTCDGKSKLTAAQELSLKNTTGYKDLAKADMDRTNNLALTKDFINNYLKSSGKDDFAACIQSSTLTAKCAGIIQEITTIGKNFKEDINKAIEICNKGTGGADRKQAGACDQISKRWLSFEALIATLKCEDGTAPVEGICKDKPVIDDPAVACPEGSTLVPQQDKTAAAMCQCSIVNPGSDGKTTVEFKSTETLPAACQSGDEPEPVAECSQYPPLKVGAELNSDCTCKNKEGGNGNIPKEDQPGFFAKLFNTKKNKVFKKTETEDRPHSCKFGPNWWLIGAGALAVGGVVALLLKKKETKTVTVEKEVVKEIDNTATCNHPKKYPVLVAMTADNPSKPIYNCVCVPCGTYYLQNGKSVEITPNPLTCACSPPPTEGGSGNNPIDASGSGGVPGQN